MPFTAGIASPGQITQNLDVILTLAYANSGDTIFDQISKNNAVIYEIKKNGMYQGLDVMEPYCEVPLMYALGSAEWYEGWDTLGTTPTEGITAAVYAWRQLACPVGYNRREERLTSAAKIKELVSTKINQTQLTMTEAFNRAFLQGALPSGGNLYTPISSPTTGRSGIEPLPELVFYVTGSTYAQPSTALTVGGLAQGTYSWWRNWAHTSAATTYTGLILELDYMYELCSRGPGGPPDLILTDEKTRTLIRNAYYQLYRRDMDSQNDYPFDNIKFRNAKVIVDEFIPDVETPALTCATYGTIYLLNTKFMKIKYDKQTNFSLGEFQKPTNQDGKVAHCTWMGNTTVMNRRKFGVIGKVARTLTVS